MKERIFDQSKSRKSFQSKKILALDNVRMYKYIFYFYKLRVDLIY